MFEKKMVPIFTYTDEYPRSFFMDEEVQRKLGDTPLTFQVGAVKKRVGSVSRLYYGRDEVFADLVISLKESLKITEDDEGNTGFSLNLETV